MEEYAMGNGRGSIASMDDCCSSLYYNRGWMLVWHHRQGDGKESARQRCICRAFHFTSLRFSREVLDRV
jgi:hypothetical protein